MTSITDREYPWTKVKSVCQAIFNIKAIVSPFVGAICGLLLIQGWIGFTLYFLISAGIGCFFVGYYGLTDLNPEVGYGDAINEGLGVSFSGFLLSWIIFYSMMV
ncbi:Rab5-interacting protein [Entamoeba marina]